MNDRDHEHRVVSFGDNHSPITPVDEECDSDQFTDTDSELEEYEQCDCVDEHSAAEGRGSIFRSRRSTKGFERN